MSNDHKIPVRDLIGLRKRLERADFLLGLVDGACAENGPWARVHLLAVLDAGREALREVVEELDGLIGQNERPARRGG